MTLRTLDDALRRFADYAPSRVRLTPAPGTATKYDLLDIDRREGKLCELIDGTLVEKAVGFREGFLALFLGRILGNFAEQADLGIVVGADGTVELFPGQVRIPDVAFYSWSKLPGRKIPTDPIPELAPDLAVEVISRSNTRGEMLEKLKDYFFAGVRLVWYVNPTTETVEVYTAPDSPTTLNTGDTLSGDPVLPGFSVPVGDLWK